MRKWCDCQLKCAEDNENTWTCCAHLAEGIAVQCRKTPNDVSVDKQGNYSLNGCPDFEPPGYDCNEGREKEHLFKLSRNSKGIVSIKFIKR